MSETLEVNPEGGQGPQWRVQPVKRETENLKLRNSSCCVSLNISSHETKCVLRCVCPCTGPVIRTDQ